MCVSVFIYLFMYTFSNNIYVRLKGPISPICVAYKGATLCDCFHLTVEIDGEEQAVGGNDCQHQHEATREEDLDGENIASGEHSGGEIGVLDLLCDTSNMSVIPVANQRPAEGPTEQVGDTTSGNAGWWSLLWRSGLVPSVLCTEFV